VVLAALEQRNKERILAGLPTYPSIEGMVESYMEFEGAEKGMSLLECEDEVVRYLQRKAARVLTWATFGPPGWLGGRGEGPRGYSLLAALRSRGEPPSAAAPTGEAAVRPRAPSAACGRRLWPPSVAEPLASLWGIRPRSALLLALPQPCPCPYPCPCLLPRQALLDEVP